MDEIPYPSDIDRLRDNVTNELQAQRALRELDLSDETLDGLASGIANHIDYAFNVTWSPSYLKDGEPHRWTESHGNEVEHFVECLHCKHITVHSTEADADDWWTSHTGAEHT